MVSHPAEQTWGFTPHVMQAHGRQGLCNLPPQHGSSWPAPSDKTFCEHSQNREATQEHKGWAIQRINKNKLPSGTHPPTHTQRRKEGGEEGRRGGIMPKKLTQFVNNGPYLRLDRLLTQLRLLVRCIRNVRFCQRQLCSE